MQKILDIWITHNCKRWTLCMNQIHYVEKMLWDLHMKTDKHKCTEISLNEYDVLHSAGSNDQRIDQRQYQQAIESLMYAVIHTHSDIFFALDWLSQYFNDSAEHHEHALKKLLQYIYSTVNLEIMYRLVMIKSWNRATMSGHKAWGTVVCTQSILDEKHVTAQLTQQVCPVC